ncbi:hypothetical protein C9374_008480 [Naegleria lovaniensis]|uniref:Uncharacterized protein n=1 Tax=Naegleria lovaniensis TaxID=51637 RepID=A0AA88GF75_NAELO|nr:uncharacterized protein C9374_008480 [Naegleria lovaniensis]KAG2378337.1 hypothetical protein C9374_008480 [Naegleria lovaniensis]
MKRGFDEHIGSNSSSTTSLVAKTTSLSNVKRKKTHLSLPSFCRKDSIKDLGRLRVASRIMKALTEQKPMDRLETIFSILKYIPDDQFANLGKELDMKNFHQVNLLDYLKTVQRLDDCWFNDDSDAASLLPIKTVQVLSKKEFFTKLLTDLLKRSDDFDYVPTQSIKLFMKTESSKPLYDTLYKLTRSDLDESTKQSLIQFYSQYPRLLFLLPCTKILNGGVVYVSKIIDEDDVMRKSFKELQVTCPRIDDYLNYLSKYPSSH